MAPALDILYLIPDPRHLISDTVLDMLYLIPDLPLDIRHRYLIYVILVTGFWPQYMTHANPYLTCFHVVQVHWPDIVTLDRTLPPLIRYLYYMTYSWLSLLQGLGMIITLLSDIWYSKTPVLLNSCILEAPKIGRLLILCSWYYTLVDPHKRIIMDIRLLWIPCRHYH